MVNRITFVDEREAAILDGLWGNGSDCSNARKGFCIFLGPTRMMRYTVDKKRGDAPTGIDIVSVIPLPFLRFKDIGFSKIGAFVFAPRGRPRG